MSMRSPGLVWLRAHGCEHATRHNMTCALVCDVCATYNKYLQEVQDLYDLRANGCETSKNMSSELRDLACDIVYNGCGTCHK